MPALHDQLSDESIGAVIEAFYQKVRRDPALGPVFSRAITDDEWPEHLSVIRDFWSSVMLKTGRYKGNPFAAHLTVEGISPALFGRWLGLFGETCREHLAPDIAADLHGRAVAIADSLQAGLFFNPLMNTGLNRRSASET
jgi:hemoglobin